MRYSPDFSQVLWLCLVGLSRRRGRMPRIAMSRIPYSGVRMIELNGLKSTLMEGSLMDKTILLSKTFWVGIITALVPLFPVAQTWISENPQAFAAIIGTIFVILRKFTFKSVTLLPK